FTIIPDEKDMERVVIARFSEKLGLVDADNLAGEPLYLSLREPLSVFLVICLSIL
ncbi:MAG: DUF4831 family protein, partial [Proteiniphilum sp.]|nr:DUF4831 family protein [Proteiniphilum sp.]